MNISNISSNSAMMQMQQSRGPSASNITSKVMETNDLNSDSLLSIEELGLSTESFNNFDIDLDGSISSDELEQSISSKLDAIKNQELTPDSFASFLSDLGVELPPRPGQNTPPDASKMASEIFNAKDGDQDGLISIEELDISEELFSSFDTNTDGSITQAELEDGLASLFSSVASGEKTKEEVGDILTELGVEPPAQGQPNQAAGPGGGGAGGGGGGSESSSDEEYDEADVNEDGVVSAIEQAIYDGISQTDMEQYTMDLVSKFLETIKSQTDDEESLDLSKYKSIMSMVNNQTQDSKTAEKLNTYLSNLE